MRNITLIKLRLNKAFRNLQDYLKISYVDGAISEGDTRYISIWEDYISARSSLLEIDETFFNSLDIIQLPRLIQVSSFFDRGTQYTGYPARSRDTINAAIHYPQRVLKPKPGEILRSCLSQRTLRCSTAWVFHLPDKFALSLLQGDATNW